MMSSKRQKSYFVKLSSVQKLGGLKKNDLVWLIICGYINVFLPISQNIQHML